MACRLALGVVLAVMVGTLSPGTALAAGGEKTSITITLPAKAGIGEAVTARARLVDSGGRPLVRALVLFTTQLAFLNGAGEATLADALTDDQGNATAELDLRTEGRFTVKAVYRGDALYAPAEASAPLTIEGAAQLYVQEAGVRIPGLNEAPPLGPVVLAQPTGVLPWIARLWPGMSGWPIAVTLLIIWSLYVSVVVRMFRVARLAAETLPERSAEHAARAAGLESVAAARQRP